MSVLSADSPLPHPPREVTMHAVAVSQEPPPQPFAHPQCALCAGAAPGLIAGVDHAEAIARLDLEEDRPVDLHLVFLLHGRRERTELVRVHIELRGRVSGDPQRSFIRGIHEPRDWKDRGHHTLVGVSRERAIPRDPGQSSSVIEPGTFLVFGNERGIAQGIATLPIAHIVRYRVSPRA